MATVQVQRGIDTSVIALDRFIQATRDSGYKGTGSAVAELVDNSIEAGATEVRIEISKNGEDALRITVADNGCGMDAAILQQALRFGGSTRFNARSGLGRYGMGLPNSSVSQARRVEVISWTEPSCVYETHLDVDEIAAGGITCIPRPRKVALPPIASERAFPSGTLVTWLRCDRLDFRRATTLAERLSQHLGRVFRHFIWQGIEILINGQPVRAIDPLFLSKRSRVFGAQMFGSVLEFDVRLSPDNAQRTGKVTVTFSLLPVAQWHTLSNDEKRGMGISKGAGMSVVRAGREVDYGWWFFGDKRKENYDDWWRCELRFDPCLDEAFGITHTKQQIRPTHEILQALVPDIEATAKALNRKVREAHEQLKFVSGSRTAETIANTKERLLPAIKSAVVSEKKSLAALLRKYPHLVNQDVKGGDAHPKYSLVTEGFPDGRFFRTYVANGQVIVALNKEHAFYRKIYTPLADSSEASQQRIKQQIDLMILAAARAEVGSKRRRNVDFFLEWGNVLGTFLA